MNSLRHIKPLLTACALTFGVLIMHGEVVGVIVVKADGSNYEIELSEVDRISFGTDEVAVVSTSGQTQEFAYADVDRIMLGSALSGIREITSRGDIAVWPRSVQSVLNVAGAEPGTEVRVYSLGGTLVASGRCPDGTLSLDLTSAPAGACIVAIGNHTVKIIKK